MKKLYPFLVLIAILSAASFACSMPLAPVANATPTGANTTAPTATNTAAAVIPLMTVTGLPVPTNTVQPLPTSTSIPPVVILPTTAVPAANPNSGPCNLAAFEADVTYPDDTAVPAGTAFSKIWRLRNNGTCTWTSGYKVIFVSGDAMGGAGSIQLTNGTVSSGSSVEISAHLTAPSTPGTYRGNYKLQAPDGSTFGIDGAGSVFYVRIVVENPNGDVPANEDESGDDNANVPQDDTQNTPTLSRNMKLTSPYMRGADVLSLQKKLLARGYSVLGSADGVFGKKTDAAVRQFQADQGLVVDGVVGPKTWNALWN